MRTEDPENNESKVTSLFPEDSSDESIDSLGVKIRSLLEQAQPISKDSPDSRPPPDHRNAVICPQCDRMTWRWTAQCIYCRFNVSAYLTEQERIQEVARHRKRAEPLMGFAWGGLIGGLLLDWASDHMPLAFHGPIAILGLACIAISFFCFKTANN